VGALADRVVESSMARRIPLSVHVDVTMRCNERCAHCYRVIEDRDELTTAEIHALLDDLARAGTLYLTLSGGEVFLRADLLDILAHARRRHFDVRLKSNALLVTAARADRLRALGVRQVDVSVYGVDPAVHDGITGVRGSFEKSLAGAASLRDAGIRVKLNCPLMTVNARSVGAVRALADRLGVMCGFDPMITARNDGDRSPVRLRIARGDLPAVLADATLGLAAPAASPDGEDDVDDVPCGAGHNGAYVSAYGDVMPCVAMPIACGNVREEPFSVIWSRSPALARVRAVRIRDLHTCSTCSARAFCTRCPGQALVEDGDLHGPARAACEHALASARAAGSPVTPATMERVPGGEP
jgi:radical SAM protein with 4Fe4S-binding SPASM domain